MTNKFVHSFLIFLASISTVSISTVNAATTNDTIEITTALLRGPAAYLEYELRNDSSRSAHAKKALIATIRLINDLHSPTTQLPHHAFGWFVYDAKEIFVHLKALLTQQKKLTESAELAQNTTEQKLSDNKDYQFLRRVVLPMLEMVSALARTKFIKIRLPYSGGNFAGITTTISRLGQLYCAAPQNSAQRKIIIILLIWCVVDLASEVNHMIQKPQFDFPDANNPGLCQFCEQEKSNDMGAPQCGHVMCRACFNENNFVCPSCNKKSEIFFKVKQRGELEAPLEKPGEPDINENQAEAPDVPLAAEQANVQPSLALGIAPAPVIINQDPEADQEIGDDDAPGKALIVT